VHDAYKQKRVPISNRGLELQDWWARVISMYQIGNLSDAGFFVLEEKHGVSLKRRMFKEGTW
jgi:hypothetical protein